MPYLRKEDRAAATRRWRERKRAARQTIGVQHAGEADGLLLYACEPGLIELRAPSLPMIGVHSRACGQCIPHKALPTCPKLKRSSKVLNKRNRAAYSCRSFPQRTIRA